MAQKRGYDCDCCGCICGTRESPLAYMVLGSLDNGETAVDAKMPAFVWAIQAKQTERQENPFRREWCGACLAGDIAKYGTDLLTLTEFEERWAEQAEPELPAGG